MARGSRTSLDSIAIPSHVHVVLGSCSVIDDLDLRRKSNEEDHLPIQCSFKLAATAHSTCKVRRKLAYDPDAVSRSIGTPQGEAFSNALLDAPIGRECCLAGDMFCRQGIWLQLFVFRYVDESP